MRVYLIDEGVLLKKGESDFDCYAHVYDNKYGYFDEAVQFSKDKEALLE